MNPKLEIRNLKSVAVFIDSALQRAIHELTPTSSTPRLDAEVLLMHVCNLERSRLITRNETALTDEQQQRLDSLLDRRKRGEPVAYITGTREFWSMELNVSPATLIPRPETELLVEKALELIPRDAEWIIADLGTGSGAIALALAQERPRCRVIGTDISSTTLDVARSNAKKYRLTNVEFRAGDWLAPITDMNPDMIVSNPPYVRAADPHLEQGDLRFEPRSVLVSGPDGLDAIRHITSKARQYLKPGGWLLLEHGQDQAEAIRRLLYQHGYGNVVCYRDLSAHDRVTECRR